MAVKRAIQACVFEIRLFNDDLAAMLRALGEMLRHNLTYLRLSLVPGLWMAVPFGLLVAHSCTSTTATRAWTSVRHGRHGPAQNPQDPAAARPVLTVPAGLRVETPAVWIPSLREAAWRISAERAGSYELTVTVGR